MQELPHEYVRTCVHMTANVSISVSAGKYVVWMRMQEWKYLHLVYICVYEHMLVHVYCLDF